MRAPPSVKSSHSKARKAKEAAGGTAMNMMTITGSKQRRHASALQSSLLIRSSSSSSLRRRHARPSVIATAVRLSSSGATTKKMSEGRKPPSPLHDCVGRRATGALGWGGERRRGGAKGGGGASGSSALSPQRWAALRSDRIAHAAVRTRYPSQSSRRGPPIRRSQCR